MAHLLVFLFAGIGAFWLRFDFGIPSRYFIFMKYAIPVWVIVHTIAFWIAKLDRRGWTYVTALDAFRILIVTVISAAVGTPIINYISPAGFPRSVYFLYWILCFVGSAGMRLMFPLISELLSTSRDAAHEKRTIIYGAGLGGLTLLREIQNNRKLAYKIIGFVDDKPDKQRLHLAGVSVLGGGDSIKDIVKKRGIATILIAIPSATGPEMTRILSLCREAGCECRTVPGLSEMIEGHGLSGQIREVAVEDLLGRTPVHLDDDLIHAALAGRVVLVTGAAGSIGSELCRQVARFKPAGIVGFDIAESPLFDIDREMRATYPDIAFYPEIGSVQNLMRLEEVFSSFDPSLVYHAAAYKHVPLMEAHVFEAVENNVIGSYNVAFIAEAHGCDSFVMISSDKAVRPTNVMGATKRVAELVLTGLRNGRTKFVAVRFGNVLGSNGSVIPIFKKQIAGGGPITVTDPEMRRFFMTIPEACQLVLQAGVIGQSGEVCVLDMGQPIKILDLAKNLILLSGLRPEVDIKIEFTGKRPGEKICEELSGLIENTVPTGHEKVRIFRGAGLTNKECQTWLEELRSICRERDTGRLVVALKEIVDDYSPSVHLLRRSTQPSKRWLSESVSS
jgi:FlaA1/EpsC-like NDP-sugar epimerase